MQNHGNHPHPICITGPFPWSISIPEPVSGGLFYSLLTGMVYSFFGVSITFELQAQDLLLVYFFTTTGIDARLVDLLKGGKPLTILLTTMASMSAVTTSGS